MTVYLFQKLPRPQKHSYLKAYSQTILTQIISPMPVNEPTGPVAFSIVQLNR